MVLIINTNHPLRSNSLYNIIIGLILKYIMTGGDRYSNGGRHPNGRHNCRRFPKKKKANKNRNKFQRRIKERSMKRTAVTDSNKN